MTPLADKLPTMTDPDLASLRANAMRLVESGTAAQVTAADEIMPHIDAELARRAALPATPATPKKRAPAKKKVPPATGHQTALPSRAA